MISEDLTHPPPLPRFQKEGVAWLFGAHHSPHGGALLADDMGLGKTVQACVFVHGLPAPYSNRAPTSLMIIVVVWNFFHFRRKLSHE